MHISTRMEDTLNILNKRVFCCVHSGCMRKKAEHIRGSNNLVIQQLKKKNGCHYIILFSIVYSPSSPIISMYFL